MPRATVWVNSSLTGSGSTAGINQIGDLQGGLRVEGISYTWDQHGPSKASFSLRRDSNTTWPDLAALSAIDIDVDGTRVWSGRISEAPQQTGDSNVISISCEGWQFHLEDDLVTKLYVHSGLSDWADVRSFAAADLNSFPSAPTVATGTDGAGGISASFPKGSALSLNIGAGVGINIGPTNLAARIVVTYDTINSSSQTGENVDILLSSTGVGTGLSVGTFAAVPTGTSTGQTLAVTITPARYLMVTLNNNGGAITPTADIILRITSIQVFSSTAWESGNVSILKASDVFKDLLASAPLLNQTDTSQITATTFSIPELYVSNPSTPGEIMRAVNAYHDYLMGVDQFRRLFLLPKPTTAAVSIGQWSNAQIQDTSAGTSTDIYNKAVLTGSAPDGTPLLVTRTATAPILTAQGLTRTKSIPIDGPTTTAALQQLGDTFLSSHSTQPFKGSVTGKGIGSFRGSAGAPYPSYLLPTLTGQLLRIDHWSDPNTAALGRTGRLSEATYTVDDDTVNVSLDNTRSNFEAFLGRLQILTQTALGG